MKAIRIIKCDEPQAWYFHFIGSEYEVYREMSDCYYVDDSLYVLKEDCEAV